MRNKPWILEGDEPYTSKPIVTDNSIETIDKLSKT
jgi:hypothetical protein